MRYFCILGNNPALSLAELVSVLHLQPAQVVFVSARVLVFESAAALPVAELIRRLGGTVKMGVVTDQCSIVNAQSITNAPIFSEAQSGDKFNFGISYYGDSKPFDEKGVAMEIKERLQASGVRSRWVSSREKVLSSVVVEQNKLLGERGLEIVIIKGNNTYYLGKTLAVQPFKELSRRDYGRPGRDDRSGMLPPKLAQIMVNVSGAKTKGTLLDPFCGSGTVLTEAALMGFKKIVGCDKSAQAVNDTKNNLQWTQEHYDLGLKTYNVMQCDVRQLSQKVKKNSVDVIVTEPYLGPARGRRDRKAIEQTAQELAQLYHEAIMQFEKVLQTGGRVVMVWPVFVTGGSEQVYLHTKSILKNSSFQKINPLEKFTQAGMRATERNTFLYGRPGQKVWREIVILYTTGI